MIIIGVIIFLVGAVVFLFGRKFFLLRAFFGDRSMFSQIFWGLVICIIGFALMYFGGAFK